MIQLASLFGQNLRGNHQIQTDCEREYHAHRVIPRGWCSHRGSVLCHLVALADDDFVQENDLG